MLSHQTSIPFPVVFSPFEPRNGAPEEPWLPGDLPRDVLWDGARVAALLDIRQMIGPRSEPQDAG